MVVLAHGDREKKEPRLRKVEFRDERMFVKEQSNTIIMDFGLLQCCFPLARNATPGPICMIRGLVISGI